MCNLFDTEGSWYDVTWTLNNNEEETRFFDRLCDAVELFDLLISKPYGPVMYVTLTKTVIEDYEKKITTVRKWGLKENTDYYLHIAAAEKNENKKPF